MPGGIAPRLKDNEEQRSIIQGIPLAGNTILKCFGLQRF